jgi:hypothetical protein
MASSSQGGVGKLHRLEDAIGEHRAVAIDLRPAVIPDIQGGDRLACGDPAGEFVDVHAKPLAQASGAARGHPAPPQRYRRS